MIIWVPFDNIGLKQINSLAKSLIVAPEAVRLDAMDLMNGLANGNMRMFEWDGGLFVVHRDGKRLVIDAMDASIWQRRTLADELKRLAADWACDTVQTTVFDRRLADAIVGIGGKVESYDVVLEVEKS